MPTARPPAPHRPRPHPARRARKIAGAVSVTSMFVLTGCMAATSKAAMDKTATTATVATPATKSSTATTATGATTTTTASSPTSWSLGTAAVAATPSPQADTSTNGS